MSTNFVLHGEKRARNFKFPRGERDAGWKETLFEGEITGSGEKIMEIHCQYSIFSVYYYAAFLMR